MFFFNQDFRLKTAVNFKIVCVLVGLILILTVHKLAVRDVSGSGSGQPTTNPALDKSLQGFYSHQDQLDMVLKHLESRNDMDKENEWAEDDTVFWLGW